TLGACGDVVRNVISCPAPLAGGLREDVLRVARRLSDHLLPRTRAYHEIWLDEEKVAGGDGEQEPIYGTRYLPRKFKIAFAFPNDNCCDVHSNDLGFLAVAPAGRLVGFNVLVGGGMGRTHGKTDTYPRLADTLGFVRSGEVVEVGEAIVKVQRVEHILADHGITRHASLTPVRGWSMACPALPTCGLAVAEAERALPDVIGQLEHELEQLGLEDAALTVRMTGCPNGCARPYTADLAFVGRSLNKYGVFVGGSMLGTRLGTLYADLVPRDRLVAAVRPLL